MSWRARRSDHGPGLEPAREQYAGVLLAGAEADITQSGCKSLESIRIENKITKLDIQAIVSVRSEKPLSLSC